VTSLDDTYPLTDLPEALPAEAAARPRRVRRRGWLVRRMLVLADVAGLSVAFAATELVFPARAHVADHVGVAVEAALFLATLPAWVVLAKLYGLYDRDEERTDHATADDLVGVFHLLTIGLWLVFAGSAILAGAKPELHRLAFFWIVAIGGVVFARAGARAVCRRQPSYIQNTVIVGAGDVGRLVAEKLLRHPEYGLRILGFVESDAAPAEHSAAVGNLPVLGPPSRLPQLVRELGVDRAVMAFPNESPESLTRLVRALKDTDVQIDLVPSYFDVIGSAINVHTIEGLPLFGLPPLRLSRSSRFLKRVFDICVSTVTLVLLASGLALAAGLIKLDSAGPVFFRQTRMGAKGSLFRIWKFRTMVADAEERKADVAHLNAHGRNGDPSLFKIRDDPRVTRVGRVLRRCYLDELPQLFNVLRGEMSLVGPRPLIPREAEQVSEWGLRRLDLKPGMTGLWQALGASSIPFEEMVKLDCLYVTTWSLWGDVRLLTQTVPRVVRGEQVP
jgi:exopolysaccharide biosynthesis polyprenyl glycosylphosphotransferase